MLGRLADVHLVDLFHEHPLCFAVEPYGHRFRVKLELVPLRVAFPRLDINRGIGDIEGGEGEGEVYPLRGLESGVRFIEDGLRLISSCAGESVRVSMDTNMSSVRVRISFLFIGLSQLMMGLTGYR